MTAAGDISIKSPSRDERVNVYKYPDNSFFPDDSWSHSALVTPVLVSFSSLFSLIFTWLSRSLVSEQCQTLSRCIVEWEQNIQWLNDMLLNINCPPFISNSVLHFEKKVEQNSAGFRLKDICFIHHILCILCDVFLLSGIFVNEAYK